MQIRSSLVSVELESAAPLAVRISGEVDSANVRGVREEIVRFLGEEPDLSLMASDVAYMDSAGLTMLVGLHHECRRRGGRLRLIEPAPRLNRVLQITGLSRVLAVTS